MTLCGFNQAKLPLTEKPRNLKRFLEEKVLIESSVNIASDQTYESWVSDSWYVARTEDKNKTHVRR